ncbi:hypothetical protein NIES4103_63880 [Nostoc sp. NIES-4103]|nr:hypothetical protein NIES4103_63880 [Nostoc sp. NIES-4103]
MPVLCPKVFTCRSYLIRFAPIIFSDFSRHVEKLTPDLTPQPLQGKGEQLKPLMPHALVCRQSALFAVAPPQGGATALRC